MIPDKATPGFRQLIDPFLEMGAQAVLFSVDYPYESTAVAAEFIEKAPVDEAARELICHGNARRLFKLGQGA